MCDAAADCDREPVVLVDVTFPADAMIDTSVSDGEDRSHPVPAQRIGYCARHAVAVGVADAGPLVAAVAVRGMRAKGRFPVGHLLADDWSWKAAG